MLALVSVVVFAATQALPGDPARAILGRTATPASLKALRDQLHLNRPVLTQYTSWVTGLLHGDLGTSLAAREPVSTYLHDRLINSAFLVIVAGIISIPLSIAIGAYAALKRDGIFDVTSSIGTLLLAALPEFVVGRHAGRPVRDDRVPPRLPGGLLPGAGRAAVEPPEGDGAADR